MRISPHTPFPLRSQLGQLRHESAILIEQFFRAVTLHPAFELLEMIGMIGIHKQWHLVRTERALNLQTIDDLRSRPTFR